MIDMEQIPTKNAVLERLFDRWRPQPQTENIPVEQAIGRVTATALFSRHTLPVVRASMKDGIAVDARHFLHGDPNTSAWVEGVDYMRADTGDDFDDRFDAVIPIEKVAFTSDGELTLEQGLDVKPGDKVRRAGSIISTDDCIVDSHTLLQAVDLAGLIMGGISSVPVIKKPVVAFIPTGSELIAPGTTPARGQNIDTNSVLAENMLREMGAEPLCLPIVPDSPQRLAQSLDSALSQADIVILNGGSSKGEDDHNARLLKQRSEAVLCHGVAAAPGWPICMALIDGKPVINLPGPTLAAFYGLDWCLRGIIKRFLTTAAPQRPTVTATLTDELHCPKRVAFLSHLAIRRRDDGVVEAMPLSIDRYGAMRNLCANGLFISPIGDDYYPAGSQIEVELLRGYV